MSEGTLRLRGARLTDPVVRGLSDPRLAKLAAAGSSAAFSAIYKRHHQEIYRYCRSILGSEQDAADAMQSTMLKAWRALDGETREISLRAWLYRIAHNESIGVLRARRTETPIEAVAEQSGGELDLEVRERLRQLISDLDDLTPRQRGALVMRELNGLSFAEIAAALEVSPEAAKQALYEARQTLAELQRGREMSCDEIAAKISVGDRRMLRARGVRSHLKGCADCREFEQAIRTRRRQLTAIAPPLPAALAGAILSNVLGSGTAGGSGIAVAGAGAASGGGLAGLGSVTAAKLGIVAALVVGAGTAALEIDSDNWADAALAPPAAQSTPGSSGSSAAGLSYTGRGSAKARTHDGAGSPAGDRRAGTGDRHGGGGRGSGHGHDPAAVQGTTVETGGSHAGGSAGAQANASTGPGSTDSATPSQPSGSDPPSSPARGPAGTPPGHGATPPGHGGTPPGLGVAPPGHGGPLPNHAGDLLGQLGGPAGQSLTDPRGQGAGPKHP